MTLQPPAQPLFPGDADAWSVAIDAAILLAINPQSLGGVMVRARSGPTREQWLTLLKSFLRRSTPVRRVPINVTDERLLGGLDLAATLKAGRPLAERGLLAEAHTGILILPSAERLDGGTVARICSAMDQHAVAVARDGFEFVDTTDFGVVAFDESYGEDETAPPALIDRLAFLIELDSISPRHPLSTTASLESVERAREIFHDVTVSDDVITALCGAALAMGIVSLRAPMLAIMAARALAAYDGRTDVNETDASRAAQLVLAPRATQIPSSPEDDREPESEPENDQPPPDEPDETAEDADLGEQQQLADVVLEAAQAAIPAGVLAALQVEKARRASGKSSGRAGAKQKTLHKGRPIGVRRGQLGAGARLNLIETLRAAAPWQTVRRREPQRTANDQRPPHAPQAGGRQRVQVRKDDFRITRFKNHAETTTIFVVDASGSSALNRLAEAKGAVELLLADCYVRRDSVALVAFRGKIAEVLLPPTRSLARAKRCLAGLPGGGGTPLALGLDAAAAIADAARRKGQTPTVIVLTDGRANIARDGTPGRPKAEADGLASARGFATAGVSSLVIDTSPQPAQQSARLADAMGAVYLPLPRADAATLKAAIQATTSAIKTESSVAR